MNLCLFVFANEVVCILRIISYKSNTKRKIEIKGFSMCISKGMFYIISSSPTRQTTTM